MYEIDYRDKIIECIEYMDKDTQMMRMIYLMLNALVVANSTNVHQSREGLPV